MKKELDEKLCKDHTKIFANRYSPVTESCMSFGFECGDGWYNIINNLCYLIQGHIDWRNSKRERAIKYNEMIKQAQAGDFTLFDAYYAGYNPEYIATTKEKIMTHSLWDIVEPMPQVVAEQVKEKFDTLRFYTNLSDDYIRGAISMAEAMSLTTCEECGNPGQSNDGGWLRVRCSEHERKN